MRGALMLISLGVLYVIWRVAAPPEWHNSVWLAVIVAVLVMGVAFHFGWWGYGQRQAAVVLKVWRRQLDPGPPARQATPDSFAT